jgi:acetate kinase
LKKPLPGNARADLALKVLAYETKKYIGAYTAILGGLDVLAFTGGIGENGCNVRAGICNGLECPEFSSTSQKISFAARTASFPERTLQSRSLRYSPMKNWS